MEAVAALGVVAAAIQFLEFSKNEPWAPVLSHQRFLTFAAQHGLWFYVQRQLESEPSLGLRQESEPPLLAYPIWANQDLNYVTRPTEGTIKTIQVILSVSADPNECFFGHSVWQYWLTIVHAARHGEIMVDDYKSLQRITIYMLEAVLI
tara:strand:+ start:817 stop:1263 length:447 start_codon:yes stop_codon:yes gene_type:complete